MTLSEYINAVAKSVDGEYKRLRHGLHIAAIGCELSVELGCEVQAIADAIESAKPGEPVGDAEVLAQLSPQRAAHKRRAMRQRRERQARSL